MELSATPLLSRSLAEFDSSGVAAVETPAALTDYGNDRHGLSWLIGALIEPLYLSLLGASMLLLGTFKRRGSNR